MYLNAFENGLTVPIYPPLVIVIATWSANKQTSKQANKQTECALSLRHASDHTMAPFTLVSWMLVAKSKAI